MKINRVFVQSQRLRVFCISFVLCAMTGLSVSAVADVRRGSGALCASHPFSVGNDVSTQSWFGVTNQGWAYSTRTDQHHGAQVFCPVPTDDLMPIPTITSVSVSGRDAHSDDSAFFQACVHHFGGGGSCGAGATTSVAGFGDFTMSLDPSAWQNADQTDYPYVFAWMSPSGNGQGTFRGWTISN